MSRSLCADEDGQGAIEVLAQRDARHVRGIALTPTQGVFGNTIDRGSTLYGVQGVAPPVAPHA
ncbi:hypothetical protein B9Z51_15890 [Limnohabitans sp. T6-5]|nr:hypothetical protein B9Z51_15890 [Limnohabitans sp. T6-5]